MPHFKDMSPEIQAAVKVLEAKLHHAKGLSWKYDKEKLTDIRGDVKKQPEYIDLKQTEEICGAMTSGHKICPREPYRKEDNSTNGRCEFHGGKSTGAKTEEGKKRAYRNLKHTPVHGLFTGRLKDELTKEEKNFMNWFEDSMRTHFVIETAIEETSLQMLSFEAVKHFRLINNQPWKETKFGGEVLAKFMRMVELHGWRRKDQNEEARRGVTVQTMMNMLDDLDEDEEEPAQEGNSKVKRIK